MSARSFSIHVGRFYRHTDVPANLTTRLFPRHAPIYRSVVPLGYVRVDRGRRVGRQSERSPAGAFEAEECGLNPR